MNSCSYQRNLTNNYPVNEDFSMHLFFLLLKKEEVKTTRKPSEECFTETINDSGSTTCSAVHCCLKLPTANCEVRS